MKKVIFALLFITVVMLVHTSVFAMAGGGHTKDDPFIVTDYAEFAKKTQAVSGVPLELYYRLDADISSIDEANDTMVIKVDRGTMHLDLSGHTITRIANTEDGGMFEVVSGNLIIDDSVGGGAVNCSLSGGFNNNMFYIKPYTNDNKSLTINDGTFKMLNGRNIVYASAINGTMTINGGTFKSDYDFPVAVPDMPSEYYSHVVINGGVFDSVDIRESQGNVIINDCKINNKLLSKNLYLNKRINDKSTVTINGKVATTELNAEMILGNIVITDPNKPQITSQPSSKTIDYIGGGAYFAVSASNAQSYSWHLIGSDGVEHTFDYAEQQDWCKLNDNSSTKNYLGLYDITEKLDGAKVYCEVSGNGYTVKSDKADISVNKKIQNIYAEIENFENAVNGHNIEEFRKVVTTDNSHVTASDAG